MAEGLYGAAVGAFVLSLIIAGVLLDIMSNVVLVTLQCYAIDKDMNNGAP